MTSQLAEKFAMSAAPLVSFSEEVHQELVKGNYDKGADLNGRAPSEESEELIDPRLYKGAKDDQQSP